MNKLLIEQKNFRPSIGVLDCREEIMSNNTATFEGELTLNRVFIAPPELIFQAWTDARLVAQWWGPTGFSCSLCEFDPRPDGEIHIDMVGPDGHFTSLTGHFISLSMYEIVFTLDAKDLEGIVLLECRTTVELEQSGPNTNLVIHIAFVGKHVASRKMIEEMETSWSQSFERLGELLLRCK
jgi:uncharacterized protein YndB with AHSA1/START domain